MTKRGTIHKLSARRFLTAGICLAIAVAVLAVYLPIYFNDFVGYDDDVYITENRHVMTGLNRESVTWAFTTGHGGNWHPLTWLSHMLDYELFGIRPGPHHMTSVLLHLVTSVLLFLVLRFMTGAVWKSAFAAALFALHPLHVESVAWAAERKDVLSTLFWMLTMGAYFRYAMRPSLARYLPALLFFALGLLAKPMLVTLPFVLLLLDWWPLGRVKASGVLSSPGRGGSKATTPRMPAYPISRLLAEKIPLIVLTAVSSAVTFAVQRTEGAVGSMDVYSPVSRLANALTSYAAYLWKTVLPAGLAVFYPHPGGSLPIWEVAGAGAALTAVTVFAVLNARKRPYLPVGWFWFLGTLVPVIGIVQVGSQAMADRYTYVPLIGIFIAAAWGFEAIADSKRGLRNAFAAAGIAAVLVYGIAAGRQTGFWRNSETLFTRAIAVTGDNHVAHNNLGAILKDSGRTGEARVHFNEALRIKPNYPEAHNNLALTLDAEGDYDGAAAHYSRAISLRPDYTEAYSNLASLLYELGRNDEALELFDRALSLEPEYAEAHYNLANMLVGTGRLEEAVGHYEEAVRLKPGFPKAHNNLAGALAYLGRFEDARAHYREALRLDPDFSDARTNLDRLLKAMEETDRTGGGDDER